MPKKLLTEIPLVRCAVDIEAKAGDHLMIFNGVVVGTYTGNEAAPVKDAEKVEAGRKGGLTKAKNAQSEPKPRPLGDDRLPKAKIEELDRLILVTLDAAPGLRLEELAETLKISKGSPRYEQLRQRVRLLTFRKKLVTEMPGNVRVRTKYRLAA